MSHRLTSCPRIHTAAAPCWRGFPGSDEALPRRPPPNRFATPPRGQVVRLRESRDGGPMSGGAFPFAKPPVGSLALEGSETTRGPRGRAQRTRVRSFVRPVFRGRVAGERARRRVR